MPQLTPSQVQGEIERLSDELGRRSEALANLFQAAAEAEVNHKREYAKALLRSRAKTDKLRESEAITDTADLLLERHTTQAVADAAREAVRSLRNQLTAVCSIGANLRTEMQMAGREQWSDGYRRSA